MRILFSEGSSTSARQSLSALGPLGHEIEICDPDPLCLGRFSRYTQRFHRCPSFTRQPGEYLDFVVQRLRERRFDVLLAVHDQVFLLARYRDDLSRCVGLALPSFEAVEELQSKIRFAQRIERLGLPQPKYSVIEHDDELTSHREFPCYVKREFSTAGQGVWRIESVSAMQNLSRRLGQEEAPQSRRYLVQQPACGDYCVVQTVFQQGRLAAAHCYTLRARGVGGSAQARQSTWHPEVIQEVARLGTSLAWHGAMHLEYFLDPGTNKHEYLEANPRIGETMNATRSGVNLCETLVQISVGQDVPPLAPSLPGVRTHSLLMSLLGAAERGANRRALGAEIWQAFRHGGVYDSSCEELVRLDDDPLSLVPAVVVGGRLLIRPSSGKEIIERAVDNYSLDEPAMRRVLDLPRDQLSAECRVLRHY